MWSVPLFMRQIAHMTPRYLYDSDKNFARIKHFFKFDSATGQIILFFLLDSANDRIIQFQNIVFGQQTILFIFSATLFL